MSFFEDIRLQNFRSYNDDTFEFSPGVNIIVGPNASGKTNLLEALLCIGLGSSYRVPAAGLVAFGEQWARLEAHFHDQSERIVKIDARTLPVKKSYEVEGQVFARLSMQRTIPIVLFEPEHLRLLSGSPERRRDFLDSLLEQTTPGYGKIRRDYQRALAQRNALLKQPTSSASRNIFAWNVRLSELGGQIALERSRLTQKLQEDLPELYGRISATQADISLVYDTQFQIEAYSSQLLKSLEAHEAIDFQRGYTTQGPHRDDMKVLFGIHQAPDVASRGEIRTLVLGLKILELRLLEEIREQKPLLLLDDVFSELDGARRQALTTYLSGYQTFITTTDADVVIQHFIDTCRIIPLG